MKRIIALVLCGGVFSSVAMADLFDKADVISVSPRFRTYTVPRTDCWNESSPAASGDRGYAGAVIGGVTGALLGNQVGKGKGKTAATATGAVAGAITGDRVQNGSTTQTASASSTKHCTTVNEEKQQPDGFDVTYNYAGKVQTDRLGYNPGSTVKVRVVIQ